MIRDAFHFITTYVGKVSVIWPWNYEWKSNSIITHPKPSVTAMLQSHSSWI